MTILWWTGRDLLTLEACSDMWFWRPAQTCDQPRKCHSRLLVQEAQKTASLPEDDCIIKLEGSPFGVYVKIESSYV